MAKSFTDEQIARAAVAFNKAAERLISPTTLTTPDEMECLRAAIEEVQAHQPRQ